MNRILHAILLPLLSIHLLGAEKTASPAKAVTPEPTPLPIEPSPGAEPSPWVDPNKRQKVIEFMGEDMSTVLRTLARRAKVNMVVSTSVKGTANIRLENVTPREVIEIIGRSNGFVLQEYKDVLYVYDADDKSPARAIAHETKLLFDALLAEKFTREEAMQLVIKLRANDKPSPAQKPERSPKTSSLTKR